MKTLKKSIKNIVKSSLLLFVLNTGSGCEDETPLETRIIQGASLTITPDPTTITQTGSNYQTEQLLFDIDERTDFQPYYYAMDPPQYTTRFSTLTGIRIGETTGYINPFITYPSNESNRARDFYGTLPIPSNVVNVVTGLNQNSFYADVALYHIEEGTYTQQTTETERVTLLIQ